MGGKKKEGHYRKHYDVEKVCMKYVWVWINWKR